MRKIKFENRKYSFNGKQEPVKAIGYDDSYLTTIQEGKKLCI